NGSSSAEEAVGCRFLRRAAYATQKLLPLAGLRSAVPDVAFGSRSEQEVDRGLGLEVPDLRPGHRDGNPASQDPVIEHEKAQAPGHVEHVPGFPVGLRESRGRVDDLEGVVAAVAQHVLAVELDLGGEAVDDRRADVDAGAATLVLDEPVAE